MADSTLSDPLERYGAIERAYCEEKWSAVIHDGQTMLADLSDADTAPPEGLKERLELLIAHSFLYGLGDRDSAEDHYQAVLHSGAEASLRQIAEQGLQQCALPVTPPESQEAEPEPEPGPEEEEAPPSSSAPPSSLDAARSGWPESAAVASPAESTVVSQPDSTLQEAAAPLPDLQDSWGAEAASLASEQASLPPDETSALSWWTAEPTSAPQVEQDSAVQPVMPWLGSDAAGASAAAMSFLPQQPIPAEASPVRQEEQARTPLMATVAEAGAVVPETPVVAPPMDRLEVLPLSSASAEAALTSAEGLNASPSSPPESAIEERLVADVVEEPELIELYQAEAPALEELLAQPVVEAAVPSAVVDVGLQASPDAQAPLPAGLDRRVADSAPREVLDRRAEPEPTPEPDLLPVSQEEPALLPTRLPGPIAAGVRPFSAPPEPVDEEDPELLMGLLKVEMG